MPVEPDVSTPVAPAGWPLASEDDDFDPNEEFAELGDEDLDDDDLYGDDGYGDEDDEDC
jgi:hypothetical protein